MLLNVDCFKKVPGAAILADFMIPIVIIIRVYAAIIDLYASFHAASIHGLPGQLHVLFWPQFSHPAYACRKYG